MTYKGNPFGTHRVIEPSGVLPQPAARLNNDMSILYDNEVMVELDLLNIDAASFTQIRQECGDDKSRIKNRILEIVECSGKMQNPVTGSGGMFIGAVAKVGERLLGKIPLKIGDRIASLVSLSLTPLKIDKILEINSGADQLRVKGNAILFESGIYTRLPSDIPGSLALAVLDVCGAPAQTARLVKPNDTVIIIGASGKSGMLCAYESRKRACSTGKIIGIVSSEAGVERLKELNVCDSILRMNAADAAGCYDEIAALTDGKLADVVINCVNITNTEMASILMCRDRGIVYFFSMATSFTKAALGAEGVGKDIDMLIGNGYAKNHAEIALNILRESPSVYRMYERLYA